MNIGSEELRALRQIKNRTQVYNFGGRFCDREETSEKEVQDSASQQHPYTGLLDQSPATAARFSNNWVYGTARKEVMPPKEYQTVYFIDEKAKERMGHMSIPVWNTCENRYTTHWCYKE